MTAEAFGSLTGVVSWILGIKTLTEVEWYESHSFEIV